jgi:hypothetical protein
MVREKEKSQWKIKNYALKQETLLS